MYIYCPPIYKHAGVYKRLDPNLIKVVVPTTTNTFSINDRGRGNIISMVLLLADGTCTFSLYTYLIHMYIHINTNIVFD